MLEQRVGRVHRLGHTRGVQVVNFVARGTIEEGMLSVLAFKQSLFAGVLDGGDSDIVLQRTRLSKFMETVEQVAGAMESEAAREDGHQGVRPLDAMPEAEAGSEADETNEFAEAKEAVGAETAADQAATDLASATAEQSPGAGPPGSAAVDAWAPLLAAGEQLLGELAAGQGERQSPWIQTDPATAQRYLKLPMPEPESVQRLAEGLLRLLADRR